MSIKFKREVGIDAGGLRREWFALMFKKILEPNFGLFSFMANNACYMPNPIASLVPNYLQYYKFIGRLMGLSIISEI